MIEANPGTRHSHLSLDRLATGELSETEAQAMTAHLDDHARAHLAAVEAARSSLPPLDLSAIRARAASVDAAAPVVRPANTTWAFLGVMVAAAAALLVLARMFATGPAETVVGGGDIRFRAGDALEVLQLVNGEPHGYVTGTPVGEGSVLGFQVSATGHRSVVVLSVDGRGETTVFWPEAGTEAEPISGEGLVPLAGSVVLDGAPGPEIFVAVYDQDVPAAVRLVKEAFADGGAQGVLGTAGEAPGVHAVEVTRP